MIVEVKNITDAVGKWFPFYVKEAFTTLKLLKASPEYTKFLIIGRSRTGSNFLRGLLNNHNQVFVFGEIFRDASLKPEELKKPIYKKPFINYIRNNPVTYIDKWIYKDRDQSIKALGFKIFYYHAHKPDEKDVWDYLKEHKEIKILHMKRLNYLDTYVSRLKAGNTDKWANTTGKKERSNQYTIDYDDCLDEFTWTENYENEYDEFFKDHQKIDVFYENLANNYQKETKKIFKFLNIDYQDTTPSTYKQRKESLRNMITNYDELKQKFSNTKWGVFFNE
ncbi:MAG TPA: sulfotransferase [Candidatus Dojkabacteria bacterium]|nr:sulfotransferase [Candidatus Dojkabacteria bacterium]